MKKFIYIVLMMAILSCCKRETGGNREAFDETSGKTDISFVTEFLINKDELIIIGADRSDNKQKVFVFNKDNNNINIINPAIDDDSRIEAAAADSEGRLWLLQNSYLQDENTGLYDINSSSFIHCYNSAGDLIKSFQTDTLYSDAEYKKPSMAVSDNGDIYIQINNTVKILNNNGMKQKEISGIQGMEITGLVKITDGRIILKQNKKDTDPGGFILTEIKMDTYEFGDEWDIRFNGSEDFFIRSGGTEYELLLCSEKYVYGYDLKMKAYEVLIGFSDYSNDFSFMNMYKYIIGSDNNYYGLSYENNNFDNLNLVKFDKSSELDYLEEKKTVTLSALEISDSFSSVIREYNSQNHDYRIEIKTYRDYGDQESYINAATDFNLDIISGRIPDIVFITHSMPMQRYSDRGLFADLYEYMDNDPGFDRNDYNPNILSRLETDGHLYTMIDSYFIFTLMGKAKDLSDDIRDGWTWDEFNSFVSQKQISTPPVNDNYMSFSQKGFLQNILFINFHDFIDLNNGTCSFDNSGFNGLVKMAGSYPAEPVLGEADFINGNPLFMFAAMNSFNHYKLYERNFGEEAAFFPVPSADGTNRSSYAYNYRIAITKDAKEKEEAWEFVKYLLTDYQDTHYSITGDLMSGITDFPVRTSSLNKLAQKSMEQSDFSVGDGGDNINTDKESRKILDLIYSINDLRSYDYTVANIIYEEAGSYFTGQKTLDEVTKLIQNRVSLYVGEAYG